MFKSKITTSITIFIILLVATSIIKNKTRVIEKELYRLSKKISLKEKDINEAQLDFYFLSSPSQIEKKIKVFGDDIYSPIENSNIFFIFSNFKDIQTKLSILNNKDEKKKKKN